MFAELLSSRGVREELVLAAPVGVMALHGGLESGTEELARIVCDRTGASRYAVVQPDDLHWHIPSIRYDPAESESLARFVDHVHVAVSIHGYGRRGLEMTVLLGGRNRRLATATAQAIRRVTPLEAIDDVEAIPPPLRGMHVANPVNLPENGGVQVELPSGARDDGYLASLADALSAVVDAELSGRTGVER